jgi:hypothetical protein
VGVDTKRFANATFGNDMDVDTKHPAVVTFGNDTVGFIRVRKRKLKGGSPSTREYRAATGKPVATASMSFDLVRAVRVNGKPRHEFVLGLGSLRDYMRRESELVHFWLSAIFRLIDHGLAEEQRQRLIAEMVRKGARLPTEAQCEAYGTSPKSKPAMDEVKRYVHHLTPSAHP